MKKNKITVSDIAKKSGVSPATVSRVINHKSLVKANTVAIVEKAMAELGYELEQSAESLASEQHIIIMNVPDTQNIFYQEVIRGAKASANARGFYLLIYESHINQRTIGRFCGLLHRIKAAGVILLNQLSLELLQQIYSITPLIQCCEYNKEAPFAYVSINDVVASQNATEHLLSCGRNKIALINGPLSYKYAEERQQGFMKALKQAHITIPQNWIVQLPEINYEMAYSAVCRLLSAEVTPNAFFAISDIFAMAVIRAAKRYGFKVPRDIMVVGFDNIEFSTMTTPSITTVNQPKFQMGYSACEILLENISDSDIESKSILFDTELLVRESTSTTLNFN